jgi:hypothetical protein
MLNQAANFLAFQVGWWACVLGAARGSPWLGPLVMVLLLAFHLRQVPDKSAALRVVLQVGLLGTIVDSGLGYLGVLQFRDSLITSWLCPPWLIAMWMIFATTLRSSLGWLAGRYWAAAVLGGIFGPVSYCAGREFGSLSLGGNVWLAVAALSALWAVLMPFLVWWASVQTGKGK